MEDETLYRLNQVLSYLVRTPGKPGDLESVLHHIAEVAKNAFGPDICVIRAMNPITGKFLSSPVTVGDLKIKNEELHEQPRPEGITQLALRDGEVYIEDLDDEDKRRYHNRFTLMEGIQTVAGLTLRTRHRKRPMGVIYLNFRQPKKFSATERESYQLFAVQASVLVQEARLAHNYEEVARIGQAVNQNLSIVDDLFKVLQTYVDTVLDESHTLVLAVYQPQTNKFDVHIRSQEHSTCENMALQGVFGYVFETQKSQYIKHLSNEAKRLPYQVINITGIEEQQSFLFVPLLLQDECLGVLSAQHPSVKAYGLGDLFVLQLLANYIALALHNMRLYNSLNQLNETGQLLTQQLESDQTLQATADKIREATQADVVVLYPHDQAHQRFLRPPLIAGELYASSREHMSAHHSQDIATLALHHELPIFATQGITIYTILSGNMRIRRRNFQQREQIRSTAMIPLKVGDEKVGVLFVNFRQAQHFDTTQKLFIEGLAHYAAIAIKNSQKYGTLIQRRIQELEILQNIDRELSRTLDLKSLLNTLLRLAYEQVHADEAAVLLYNSRAQALEVPAAIGANAESRRKDIISLQATKYITRWVLEHKKPARVDNVHRDPHWRNIYIQGTAGTISELDVPLLDGEEAVGVLNFESAREGAFNQQDEDFLLTLAGQAVLAIKNAQAYEREKRLAEEGQVLNAISKEITSQLDYSYVFDLILEKALELTNSTLGSVHIYHAELNELEMVAERGVAEDMKRKRQGLHEGIVGYVAKHRHFLNVEDVSQAPWDKIYVEFIHGTRSELAAPMLAGNKLWGVLNIESPNLSNFGESDERLLQGLADLAVIALQNAHAYEREKRLLAEAQLLNEISKEITSQLDRARIFDLFIEKALELTNSNLGSLMLYDADRNDLYMVAEHGVAEDKKGARQSLDEGIVGYVATHKRLLNVVDVSQHPWNEIYLEFIPGTRSELAVPMLAGNELRGVLNVESFMPNHFSESEERLLQGLADLAVVALQNAQAYEREKRIAEERKLLNEISKEITSQFDHMRVFDLILKKTLELTRSTLGALLLYAPESQDLWIACQQGLDNNNQYRRIRLDEGIVGYVATHKESRNIGDVSQPDWNSLYLDLFHGTRSELAVPMLAGVELRGVINVESTSPYHFSESDERLLQGLADLAVMALQNANLFNQAKMEAERFELLYQTGQKLSKITDVSQLDQAYDTILNYAESQSDCQIVIRRYNEEAQELELIRASQQLQSLLSERTTLDEGVNGQVAREKSTIVIEDTQHLPVGVVTPKLTDATTRSLGVIPIKLENRYYGNLGFRHEEAGHFRHADIKFFEGLAQQLASTIYRVEAVQARRDFEQRALAAEEISSIGEFTLGLIHQLADYLGGIRSDIDEIQEELKGEKISNRLVSGNLNHIQTAVRQVLNLREELKDTWRKSGRAIEGDSVVIAPNDLFRDATQDIDPSLLDSVSLEIEIEDGVAQVRVYRRLVIEILHDLLSNAIQAMPHGGTIMLKAHTIGRYIALDVSDTGSGIPSEDQAKIFNLNYSTKGGFGFGLWSAKRNAQTNGGDLEMLESQLGRGTTFRLSLPKAETEGSATPSTVAKVKEE